MGLQKALSKIQSKEPTGTNHQAWRICRYGVGCHFAYRANRALGMCGKIEEGSSSLLPGGMLNKSALFMPLCENDQGLAAQQGIRTLLEANQSPNRNCNEHIVATLDSAVRRRSRKLASRG